jgi:hypothetical protein
LRRRFVGLERADVVDHLRVDGRAVVAGGRRETVTHILQRPSWRCSCGELWPCRARREELLDEYSGQLHELRLLMSGFLHDAFGDAEADVEARRAQLVAWLPPRGRRVPDA